MLLSEAQNVREALQETHPETKEHLDNLLRFMERFSYEPTNKLFLPGRDIAKDDFSKQLAWFIRAGSSATGNISWRPNSGLNRLFGYARALVQGCGFVDSGSKPREIRRLHEQAHGQPQRWHDLAGRDRRH